MDFKFLKSPVSKKWVVLAPRRSQRPNVNKKTEQIAVCPFCIGKEGEEQELYRVPVQKEDLNGRGAGAQLDSSWHIRVIPNKFPFAPIHEIIIHSPDHHKSFDELPFSQVELIIQTYVQRYNANRDKGQVYIFHNHGIAAGESLPHPHTQLVVVPRSIPLDIPPLNLNIYRSKVKRAQSVKFKVQNDNSKFKILNFKLQLFTFNFKFLTSLFEGKKTDREFLETEHFFIFCPETSEWPDEVWVAPKRYGGKFGSMKNKEVTDLAFVISRLIQIYDMRNGHEFPFNFYIYPGKNWYLRLIPRIKTLGGFELGTNIIVNTKDPKETFGFIKEHFWMPDLKKIATHHKADYWKSV